MRSVRSVLAVVALVTVGLSATSKDAHAAPTFCVPGPNTDTLLVSDVTFRGSNADDCYGVVRDSGLTLSEVNTIWTTTLDPDNKYGSGGFTQGLYANGDSVTFNGLNWDFDLSNSNGGTFGTWDLEITEVGGTGPFPQTLDILFLILDDDVNPDSWAMYLFDNETFTNTFDVNGNHWSIGWNGSGNYTPKYDAAVLLFRNGTPGTGSGSGSGQAAIPEPASLLLLGSGLGAAAMRARRKKAVDEKP